MIAGGRAAPRIADVIAFLRARVDELTSGWLDGGCAGAPGSLDSCCEALGMTARMAVTMRQRIDRYEHACALRGGEDPRWREGVFTALWLEVRADAAMWQSHPDYRSEWAPPANHAADGLKRCPRRPGLITRDQAAPAG